MEGFLGGRALEVGVGEFVTKGDLEGGDDEALLVLGVFGVFLQKFLGELVDLVVVLPLDGLDQRLELVLLAALHINIYI